MTTPAGEQRFRSGTIVRFAALIVLVLVGSGPLITPSATEHPEADAFSIDRVMEHIGEIAKEPHPMGSEAIIPVREYLIDQIVALGLTAELQVIPAQDYFGAPTGTVEVVNVLTSVPGSDPSKAILVVGHYDTVPWSLGANDNAAAVGVMLEVARVLTERPSIANDVILLFTDGEEPSPRFGSKAFVADHPWMNDVGFVINLEAAGISGPSVVAETSGQDRWVIDGYAASASNPVAYSFVTEIVGLIGEIGTDFDSFRRPNLPGIHFAYMRGSPAYHTLDDSPDNVSRNSAAHHGSNVLGVIDAFGDIDLSNPPEAEAGVYFAVGRSDLIRYPASWSLPLTVLLVSLFGAALALGVNGGVLSIWAVLRSALLTAVGMVGAILTVTIAWWAITSARNSPGTAEGYVYLVLLLLLSGVVWRWVAARGRGAPETQLGGVALAWLVLAVATGVWLPGTNYLFVWPTLVASGVLLVRITGYGGGLWGRVASLSVVAVPVAVLLIPATDVFFQMAMPRPGNPGSQVVFVVAGAALLGYLAIALIAATWNADTSGSAS